MNEGPREQFAQLFPDEKARTVLDTQLMREGQQWFPETSANDFKFKEAGGSISEGLNLDGKVGANDFTSPEGERGIDNQLFRAIGCINHYRSPDSLSFFHENLFLKAFNTNRFIIEISDIDSLINDDDVIVTTYRGLDSLLTDATGQTILPGGTLRIDQRWGKPFITSVRGKIVNGILTTEPTEIIIPTTDGGSRGGVDQFKAARFSLSLTNDHADGLLGGYVGIKSFYRHLVIGWSTHHLSYGQVPAASLFGALQKLADGYPSDDGKMSAISFAWKIKFVQVFLANRHSQKIARAE